MAPLLGKQRSEHKVTLMPIWACKASKAAKQDTATLLLVLKMEDKFLAHEEDLELDSMNDDYMELIELAEKGDNYAQNSLAANLAQNMDEKSQRAALYWYLRAVENGYIESMWNAATMLMNGEGCKKNREFAQLLINIAANHKHNSACLYLADAYEFGSDGYDKNEVFATKWRDSAWDIDNAEDYASPVDPKEHMKDYPPKPELICK